MSIVDPMIQELEFEADATRRVLERVPTDKLEWQPHAKSFSIGKLAMHLATIPGEFARLLAEEYVDFAEWEFASNELNPDVDLVALVEESVQDAKNWLASVDDDQAFAIWRGAVEGEEMVALPRIAVIRSMIFNHWYHHRGQMCVYLRLLDIPVPAIYGPSADENPFAGSEPQ
ncbi:MAG: DinB family protein [Gemmatimonadetes bacterium]|nr:DinB family protein [Gemmatimonadota bacterium]